MLIRPDPRASAAFGNVAADKFLRETLARALPPWRSAQGRLAPNESAARKTHSCLPKVPLPSAWHQAWPPRRQGKPEGFWTTAQADLPLGRQLRVRQATSLNSLSSHRPRPRAHDKPQKSVSAFARFATSSGERQGTAPSASTECSVTLSPSCSRMVAQGNPTVETSLLSKRCCWRHNYSVFCWAACPMQPPSRTILWSHGPSSDAG